MDGTFRNALERGDLAAIRKVAKADLHTHGFSGLRLSRYRAWTTRELPDPPARFLDFADFDHYLIDELSVPFRDESIARKREFFGFFLSETIGEAVRDGVVAIEPSIDVTMSGLFDGDVVATAEYFGAVIDRALEEAGRPAIDVRPELGMARGTPLEYLETAVPPALETGFYRSIDLYGDERVGGIAEYAPFWRLAGERGMRRKAHAGELCPPGRVRESVDVLCLDAVQHGISAAEDPRLMEYLARRGVTLNVCPTSNVRLARAASIAEHPIRALFDAGVRVTVNTDDLIVFDSGLSEEFLKLRAEGVFTAAELDTIRENAL
jgi:adenosine deaminase